MAKILLLDIETAPAKVYSWGLFQQDHGINQVIDDGYILCWCAKWLDKKEIMSDALINHTSTFNKNKMDDSKIMESMWSVLDEADVVVTHNGNNFDLKWLNTSFVKNGLSPIQTYKLVDTFLAVKRNFHFLSNKLDFLCQKLDLGKKISTGGFELWVECMNGVKSSWVKMVKYCKHDVELLERLYLKLRPFLTCHPNLCYIEGKKNACPNCGSLKAKSRGWVYRASGKYRKMICIGCGRNYRDQEKIKERK